MSNPNYDNFGHYYTDCPRIIIRSGTGKFYNYGGDYPGTVNTICKQGENSSLTDGFVYPMTNNKMFLVHPWSSTVMLSDPTNDYTKKVSGDFGVLQSSPKDNAIDDAGVDILDKQGDIPGYIKRSIKDPTGRKDKNGRIVNIGYLNASPVPPTNVQHCAFSVYEKKPFNEFFLDFYNSTNPAVKTKFADMASGNARYGNQRYNDYLIKVCNDSSISQVAKDNCAYGESQWCLDDFSTRVTGDFTKNASLSADKSCYPVIQRGGLDNNINDACTPERLNSVFCTDIRKNVGTTYIKDLLNKKLGTFCANDTNITTANCSDVYNACSATNAGFDNTTVPNYNCNTLISGLKNDTTKNKMLEKTDLSKLNSNLTIFQKKNIISKFNSDGNRLVESALCTLAANTSDPICNFSNFINTSDTNPILVMYFNDDNTKAPFAKPVGIDYHNSLSFTQFNDKNTSQKFFNTTPNSPLTQLWYAKFYVYISPSIDDEYLFTISTITNARVYLNNTLIIDAWSNTIPTKADTIKITASAFVSLKKSAGPYLLYIEYRNISTAVANIQLSYTTKSNPSAPPTALDSKLVMPLTTADPILMTVKNFTPTNPPPATNPTLWMNKFNPYVLTQTAQTLQSINYCTANNRFATDPVCIGTSTNSFNGINNIYTSDTKNPEHNKFQSAILDYCSDPQYSRFATDTVFCNSPNFQSYLLKPIDNKHNDNMLKSMNTYCSTPANNQYTIPNSQNYCRTADNTNNAAFQKDGTNLSMLNSYATTIRNGRMNYMSNALKNSLSTNTTPVPVTQDVIDYIKDDYPIIQKNTAIDKNDNIKNLEKNIIDYCADPNFNRFATDPIYCNNDKYISNVLKTTTPSDIMVNSINAYCQNPNPINQTYCRTVDNQNNKNYTPDGSKLNMNVKYADTIRGERHAYVQKAIKDAMNVNNQTPGEISQDVINYIKEDYPIIQANQHLKANYPNNKLLSSDIYPYCENLPDYTKNKLCNTIYGAFNADPNIQASNARINDYNTGIASLAFMGQSNNEVANTEYTKARDAPDSFARFLPYAIQYCGTDDNIIRSECQNYYNNVSNVINTGLSSQYKANSTYKTPTISPDVLNQINANGKPEPIIGITKATPPTTTPPTTTPPTSTFTNKSFNNNYDDEYGIFNSDYEYTYGYIDDTPSNWLYQFILFLCLVILITMVMRLVRCKNNTQMPGRFNNASRNIFIAKTA